jgi:excisionase family DNA binding protein
MAQTSEYPSDSALLSIEEGARHLGVARNTIYEFVKRGELHFIKVGRRSLLSRVELDSMVSRWSIAAGIRSDPAAH